MNEQKDPLILAQDWEASETGYPEPTVITVDENTDFSKIHEEALPAEPPKIRRSLIGMLVFHCPEDFETWQRDAPREIFEVTPKAIHQTGNSIAYRIFVTYNAGVIE
jgi:hypothetical protein